MKKPEKGPEIGARIRQARLEAGGMKQRELADLLGVTERSVIAYEQGDVIPYRFIRDLERILDRPAAWILHGQTSTPEQDAIRAELERLTAAIDVLTKKLEEITPTI